ncbi:hypothetical protein STCU_10099 [Strigomonas culicis]|uniref:Uncharacterized protein n=1 Tax=Strigomonas culicis TaxID=28005 RepID=S9TJH5_9TRYP|nr:hypothetical protein STCU_10099 [Strigomonas culicis]|eukprot:EPY18242.1 hypothetical protein STCU_10099 [Strigomonas culicis]
MAEGGLEQNLMYLRRIIRRCRGSGRRLRLHADRLAQQGGDRRKVSLRRREGRVVLLAIEKERLRCQQRRHVPVEMCETKHLSCFVCLFFVFYFLLKKKNRKWFSVRTQIGREEKERNNTHFFI